MSGARTKSPMLVGFNNIWRNLPDSLLLHIFCFLSPNEVVLAGEVCRNWNRVSEDELLWKHLLQKTLLNRAGDNIELPVKSSSWFEEYKRIYQTTPVVEGQVLKEHTDEVLHVTFSHDGQLLASSSKDCSVILWRVYDFHRVKMVEKINFEDHNWEYVQFCEFNKTSTLLLVSGVNKMRDLSFRGEFFSFTFFKFSIIHFVCPNNKNNDNNNSNNNNIMRIIIDNDDGDGGGGDDDDNDDDDDDDDDNDDDNDKTTYSRNP